MSYYYIYIMSNPSDTRQYVGVCNDIKRMLKQHKSGNDGLDGFPKLIYFERCDSIGSSSIRIEQLRRSIGHRLECIKAVNKEFADLSMTIDRKKK